MEQTKTTSIRYLLQQMQSRFKLNHSNWRADAIDNVGLIINEIGYHIGYEPKDIEVNVRNFRVKVPDKVVSLGKVLYNGYPLAIADDRDDYMNFRIGRPKYRLATSEEALELEKETKRLNTLKELYLENPTNILLDSIIDSQRKIALLVNGVTYENQLRNCRFDWYRIESGYIKTSFEDGSIILEADCFILDDEGLPMVIDTFKYREACIWGMMWYLCLQGYVHPTLSLQYIENKKDEFVAQAKNEPKIMTIERHQRFTEEWSSISRGINNITLNRL